MHNVNMDHIDLDDLNRVKVLKNSKGYIIMSDKTGWRHLYYHDINGKLINAVTSGNYTVTGFFFHPSSGRAINRTKSLTTASLIRSIGGVGDLGSPFQFDVVNQSHCH